MQLKQLGRHCILKAVAAILDRRSARGFDWIRDVRYWSGQRGLGVVFDVGANVGQTTIKVRTLCRYEAIHCFEPGSVAFCSLGKHFYGCSDVILNRLALGDKPGEVILALDENSERNKVVSVRAAVDGRFETVDMITLDEYVRQSEIEQVGLLKTDTEGFDCAVLRGASRTLAARRIRFILSEVGFADDDTQHTPFIELVELMRDHGYRLIGLYDLVHRGSDHVRLEYANALFAP